MDAPRVGFLWHGDRNVGGGERSTALLVHHLAPDYHPIVFYSRRNHLIDEYEQAGVQTVPLGWSPVLTSVYRDRITVLGAVARLWHLLVAMLRTTAMLRRHRIDLLHAVDNVSKIVGSVAARLAGIPVVAHCRDELTHSAVERWLLTYQRATMDRVIAVADAIGDHFSRHGRRPSHVVTIHNGIDLQQFDPARVTPAADVPWTDYGSDVRLGVIALFDPVKGHRHLFAALARLIASGTTGWRCVVAGDGRDGDALQAMVVELQLSDRVTFLGYRKDAAAIVAGLDVVVIPSDQEAFPRAALEAMALGKPLVASRVGGLPEAVIDGESGLLVPAGNVDAMASALARLIGDSELRSRMGAAGRERVARLFTIERNVRLTKRLYEDVLGHRWVTTGSAP